MVSNALIFQHEQVLRLDIMVAGRRRFVLNLSIYKLQVNKQTLCTVKNVL